MTSQRFLNDHVNSRDFSRSLMQGIMFPIIMFVVLLGKFMFPVVEFASKIKTNLTYLQMIEKKEIISYFGGMLDDDQAFYPDQSLFTIFAFAIGALLAMSLFSFAFKKNSVNVYFSMGITRTRLWINRIAAGAAELFVASAVPFLIIFIMNTALFGFHKHQLALAAYYTFLMFTSSAAGLVFGALAASVSGSRIEMLFTTVSSSTVFLLAALVFSEIKDYFLRGYVPTNRDEGKALLLSPLSALLEHSAFDKLITGKKIPADLVITWKTDIFPIVLWTVLSGLVFALGMYLFKKRKNENSNSLGKFGISSALNGVWACLLALSVMIDILSSLYYDGRIKSIAVCILLCVLGTALVFFIAELILRRNLKSVRRMIPVYCGLLAVSFAAFTVVYTEYFGTFNKLPEAKDVSYIAMSYNDPLNAFSVEPIYGDPERYDDKEYDYVKSDNPEDIKLCLDLFGKVKDDKMFDGKMKQYISFVIKTKDGSFISRRFPVYSENLVHDYSKAVFESEYFSDVVGKTLSAKISDYEAADEETTVNGTEYGMEYGTAMIPEDYDAYGNTFEYYGGSLISDGDDTFDPDFALKHEMTSELCEALCTDIAKMSYDDYYGKSGEPVGAISNMGTSLMNETMKYNAYLFWLDFYNHYEYDDTQKEPKNRALTVPGSAVLVYPQMTETLAVLGDIQPNPQKTAVKAVLCPEKKFTVSDALETHPNIGNADTDTTVFSVQHGVLLGVTLAGGSITDKFMEKSDGTYNDFLEIVHNESGVKLNRIDDTEKAKKIADASRSVYDTYGDDGRYVYVIFEDGSVATKYLPEKSLSVLN